MGNLKILIVSHNGLSLTNNMGKTLLSLFDGFEKEELAQLYFHKDFPDSQKCLTYFQITDFNVLKSVISRKSYGEQIKVKSERIIEESKIEDKMYKIGKTHSQTKLLMRDTIWKLGKWKTSSLINWLEDFQPTHIFYASGDSMFSFDIALEISTKFDIPLITYFCDDYYNQSVNLKSPIDSFRNNIFRKKVKDTIYKSSDLVFISESMNKEYEGIFQKKGNTIMTPAFNNFSSANKNKLDERILISYIGNVELGRLKELEKFATAISSLTKKYNLDVEFEVYSGNNSEEVTEKLTIEGKSYFKGSLSSSEVIEKINESHILLHVESFEEKFISKTKHSISTKIADLLVSDRLIIGMGPNTIASIAYLKQNNAAFIIDDKDSDVEKMLIRLLEDNKKTAEYLKNSKRLASNNHDIKRNTKKLRNIFENSTFSK